VVMAIQSFYTGILRIQIPDFKGKVRGGRSQILTIGTIINEIDVAGVPFESGFELAGLYVPKLYSRVVARGSQLREIGVETQASYR
jgi:hypothetical protein